MPLYGPDLRARYAEAPTAREIRAQAVDSALQRTTAAGLAREVAQLADDGLTVRAASKLVLWPVRLQHVCDFGAATGNADAVAHYAAIADARHRRLVADALTWRDRMTIPDPESALGRITDEILDLHAEVLTRVAAADEMPRGDELGARAQQLGDAG